MKEGMKGVGLGPLGGLATLRDYRSKRISSWDRTGGNDDFLVLKAGEKRVLGEIEGAGCVRRIWITTTAEDPHYLRKMLLRMYWDGEKEPSVEAPLGDFFGVGHGVANHFISLPLNMITGPMIGNRAAMNCFFPMPFSSSARFELENDSKKPAPAFYYHIDYESYEELEADQGRFHAQWRRENPCQAVPFEGKEGINLTGEENYVILEAEGRGHYVGCVLNVHNLSTGWFGEGDDMIFVDGEKWPPSVHGTGTEDYFGAAYGFPAGEHAGAYHGVSLVGNVSDWSGKWSVYRFHLEDPINFRKAIRVTIEHGHANDLGNDYSSMAYWYQLEPHKKFPEIARANERIPRI